MPLVAPEAWGGWDIGSSLPYVILDGKATGAFVVVPGEVYAGEAGAGPVLGDLVMLEEGVTEVVGVAFVDVFYAEVVNN